MAATLGPGPDRLIARAQVVRMSEAVILQACAALGAVDIAEFADAAFRGKGGMTEAEGRFEIVKEFLEGKTTRINTYVDDRGVPIQLGGRTCRTGFGVHADSILRFRLPENAVGFTALGGHRFPRRRLGGLLPGLRVYRRQEGCGISGHEGQRRIRL